MMKIAIGFVIGFVIGSVAMLLQIKESNDYTALESELKIKEEKIKALEAHINQMGGNAIHCPAPELMLGDELMWPKEVK